jgi:hypothetical protein
MVSFTLTEFNSTVSMDVSGRFDASAAFVLDSSAIAVLYVSTAAMQNTFRFTTESTNFDDVSLNDVKYYVYKDNWTNFNDGSLNPVNAHLSTINQITTTNSAGAILNSNELLVKHDFLRYVATRLFNTPYGVDLFSNEAALISNLNLKGGLESGILSDISGKLFACDISAATTPSVAIYGDLGSRYATDEQADATNICRELLRQLYNSAPNRFSALTDGETSTIRKIPFVDDDIINFKIIVNAATGQETITGVVPIPARTYTISLVLTSNPANINPVPAL